MVCSADSGAAFVGASNSYVSVWLTNYTAWEAQDNQPPTLTNTALDGSGTSYWDGGIWRFAWSEDRSIMLDNLEGQASAYCPWYRIRWHECDHDGEQADGSAPDGCQWDEVRSNGPVPEGV